MHTRSCRYQRAPGTEAPALSKHYRARVASTAPRQTAPPRHSMAAQELALPNARGAPQRDAGWLERGVTRDNVALLVLGLLAVKAFLGHEPFEAAALVAATCVLAGAKLLEPSRVLWLVVMLTFALCVYCGWCPFWQWFIKDVIVTPVRDGFSKMEKDPQLEAGAYGLLFLGVGLFVDLLRDGPISRKGGDVLGRLLQAEGEIEDGFEEHAPDFILSLSGLLLFFENYFKFSRGAGNH